MMSKILFETLRLFSVDLVHEDNLTVVSIGEYNENCNTEIIYG